MEDESGHQVPANEALGAGVVTLVGLMGAGKSSVASQLAARWGWTAIDLDHAIEAREGLSVQALFDTLGESGFRAREYVLLRESLLEERIILATGGGAPCTPGAMEAILAAGPVVWLRGSPEVLADRVCAQGGRPLLAGHGPRESAQILREQLRTRGAVYAQATWVVDVDELPVNEVVDRVTDALLTGARS